MNYCNQRFVHLDTFGTSSANIAAQKFPALIQTLSLERKVRSFNSELSKAIDRQLLVVEVASDLRDTDYLSRIDPSRRSF